VTAVALDLAARDGPARLIERAVDESDRVDVLVSSVGAVRLRLEGFVGISGDEFERATQMNFFAAVRAAGAALGPMVDQGEGAIVNTASANAFFQPGAGMIDYRAAKAALVNLSESLAQEFGPSGIRVNCVSPGAVVTELWFGEHGVAATVAQATGVDADTTCETVVAGTGGLRNRSLHDTRRCRRPNRDAGFEAHRERHRRQLRHRRRPHQDNLGTTSQRSTDR
jgi:NAD(P)-dependent dehydrogenase (short-subunit alcohol dehydrogenase family)